jgi:LysM repeat protein
VPFGRTQRKALAWRPILRVGSSGKDIYELQTVLKEFGYLSEEPDGKYGIITEEAVQQLQRDYGLIPDGVVGRKTRDLIRTGKVFKNRTVHTVKRGESLSDISNLYGVEEDVIIRSNRLFNESDLWEGQKIGVFKRTIMGMMSPDSTNVDVDIATGTKRQLLDAVISLSVYANEDGTLSTKGAEYLEIESGVFLRVSTTAEGCCEQEMVMQLLLDEDLLTSFAAECVELVQKSSCGLLFDLWIVDEKPWIAFVRFLSILRKGLSVDIPIGLSLPVKAGIDISVRTLSRIGSLVDWILVGGPVETRALTSSTCSGLYEHIKPVLSKLVTCIPRQKIMLTILGYGLHLASGRHNYVRPITVSEAEWLAYRYGTKASWDQRSRAYTFSYRSRRTEHMIWYDGARGLKARCALVNKYNLGGIMVCYIDVVNDEFWNMVGRHFVSEKNVFLCKDMMSC